MKTLTLILLSALFGVAVHIQASAPEPPPVDLASIVEWPGSTGVNQVAMNTTCVSTDASVFAWWPVADYFLSTLVVDVVVPDPIVAATRRCI